MYKAQHKTFALVMMDIFLPKMDGLQSIRLIRKFEAENKSKRILFTFCYFIIIYLKLIHFSFIFVLC